MSTVPVRLPCCGTTPRVAVQVSSIETLSSQVVVHFDSQIVTHECRPTPPADARRRAHSLHDCWCGMPHRPEDFL